MEIVLIRHGKPASANNPRLSASEYTKWIRRYNSSQVDTNSRPKKINGKLASYFLVASDYKRAIHSTQIYTDKQPKIISPLYREMDIPRFKLPFRLKAFTWVYLCRVLWIFGLTGSFESYKLAKQRAKKAANELVQLANENERVVLFGHGYMNLHILRELVKKGWELQAKSSAYWGESALRLPAQ